MERIVERVQFPDAQKVKLLRTAAYARVSSGKDAMLHSLSAQVSYYNDLIQSNPKWLFCGIFADEALTGTKDNRENFQKLLSECRAGHIDLIITKSISRFARNTVTLLETVRELKEIGVDVFFEEQNIHSLSADGELLLTILASYAQEESYSASENKKWQIRRDFEQGKVSSITMLGYKRNRDGVLEIVPEEAKIVRLIFNSYLSGMGKLAIANMLNEMHISTKFDNEWTAESIRRILTNEKYCGDLLLQKSFRNNHIEKKKPRIAAIFRNILRKILMSRSLKNRCSLQFKSVCRREKNASLLQNQLPSFIRSQAGFSANAAARITAEKQRQRALCGAVRHTTQGVKNTVRNPSRFPKIR